MLTRWYGRTDPGATGCSRTAGLPETLSLPDMMSLPVPDEWNTASDALAKCKAADLAQGAVGASLDIEVFDELDGKTKTWVALTGRLVCKPAEHLEGAGCCDSFGDDVYVEALCRVKRSRSIKM